MKSEEEKKQRHREATKRWQAKNRDHLNAYARARSKDTFEFKGKHIRAPGLRKNICSKCGKKYPQDLTMQTHLHHEEYDEGDPRAHIIELCSGCHTRLHNELRGFVPGRTDKQYYTDNKQFILARSQAVRDSNRDAGVPYWALNSLMWHT